MEIIEEQKKPKTIIITARSVMGALADYAVQQSPYHRPDNLEVVLDKFYDLIKDEVNDTGDKYIKKFETWNDCHKWIADKLYTIPEFKLWNERKNGNQSPFGFSGAGEHDNGDVTFFKAKADNDFIDLDALTRNITNLATE